MATWPATLPQTPHVDGYEEQAPTVTVRTQMDAGPAKIRRRFTAAPRPINVQLKLTKAQRQTLDDFHVTTLLGGSLPFDWRHPVTQANVSMRFREAPTYTAIDPDEFTARCLLEIMP